MKKNIFVIISLLILLNISICFGDYSKSAFPEIDWASSKNIFPKDIQFNSVITKGQFVKALANYLYDWENTDDVCDYACIAKKRGIIDKTNDLNNPLTLAVATKMILRASNIDLAEYDKEWYKLWIEEAGKYGYFNNLKKTNPNDTLTKYEAILLMYNSPLRFRMKSSDYTKDITDFVISYVEDIEKSLFYKILHNYWDNSVLINIKETCPYDSNEYLLDMLKNGTLEKIWINCAGFKTYFVEVLKVEKKSEDLYLAKVIFFKKNKENKREFMTNINILVEYSEKFGYRTKDFQLVRDIIN